MATPTLIPVSEYLATTYRPDRDYIDGELKERHLGETQHATTQGILTFLFKLNRDKWGVRAFPEQRVQVQANRFRVPDVCVVRVGTPPGAVIRTPPLICIEILSPEDSIGDMQERVDDYVAMGVENIWLFDPGKRRGWTADANGMHPLTADSFTVPGTPIRIPIAELNHELDEMEAGR